MADAWSAAIAAAQISLGRFPEGHRLQFYREAPNRYVGGKWVPVDALIGAPVSVDDRCGRELWRYDGEGVDERFPEAAEVAALLAGCLDAVPGLVRQRFSYSFLELHEARRLMASGKV